MSEVAMPDSVDAHARGASQDVLADAPVDGDVLALTSFGHDSLTAMDLARRSRIGLDGIIHVNTGVGVPQTRSFGKQRVEDLGLDYYEVGSAYRYHSESYAYRVERYGFPGPAVHKWEYLNLKEKPLERWLRAHYPDRELTLVSGVRRQESKNRMENVDETGQQEYLGTPTIAPLVAFTGIDVTRYRRDLGLPSNPVVDALEMSGECLCGCFASRGERRMIRLFYPSVHRRLTCLEARVSARSYLEDGPDRRFTRWGHGRFQDRELDAMTDDAQMLLCESCEHRAACGGDVGDA